MAKKATTHGGARAGAGRPLAEHGKRVSVTFLIPETQRDAILDEVRAGETTSDAMRRRMFKGRPRGTEL